MLPAICFPPFPEISVTSATELQVLQGCHHLIEWVGQVGLSRFCLLAMHIRGDNGDNENIFKKKQGSYGTVNGKGCEAGQPKSFCNLTILPSAPCENTALRNSLMDNVFLCWPDVLYCCPLVTVTRNGPTSDYTETTSGIFKCYLRTELSFRLAYEVSSHSICIIAVLCAHFLTFHVGARSCWPHKMR